MNRSTIHSESCNRARRGWLQAVGASVGPRVLPGLGGATAMLLTPAVKAAGAPRTALVIGNADYDSAPLKNPVNDARLVAATLQDLGFDVHLLENGDLRQILGTVRDWLIGSADSGVRVFYFAGHGTQFRGQNYLVPIGINIVQEKQIERSAVALSTIVNSLSRTRQGVNFVIVDACRTEPRQFLRKLRRTRGVLDPLGVGFAAEVAPRGTVVAYSTSPGALAADGVGSRNSVFTQALARQMRERGLTVESLFKRVRIAVMRKTKNAQIPWESSSLIGEFCFTNDAAGRCGR